MRNVDPRGRSRVMARAGRQQWYRMAVQDSTATIDLYDAIGGYWGVSAAEFVRELRALDVETIELHVNSPGGDVYDGIAMRSALRSHPARVVAYVDGLAASAASFVLTGADEVVMGQHTEQMIHDAWGLAIGNAGDMTRMAADLDRVSDNIASMYAGRGTLSTEEFRALMLEETWLSAEEAVALGLADRVDEDEEEAAAAAKARFDLSVFAHAGRGHAPAPRVPTTTMSMQTPGASATGDRDPHERSPVVPLSDDVRSRLGIAADADEGTILAALDEALAERADPTTPTAPLPPGTVLVDSTLLDQLRADGAAGRAARDQQNTEDRERRVTAALNRGAIGAPAADPWRAAIEKDPSLGAVLDSMPSVIPVGAIGHDGDGPANEVGPYEAVYGSKED